MGWDVDQTLGKLHRFWYWSLSYALDGDLRDYSDDHLGRAVGLDGVLRKQFVDAMIESRWIEREPYFRIHDWWDYVHHYVKGKFKDRPDRWQHIQRLYGDPRYAEKFANGLLSPFVDGRDKLALIGGGGVTPCVTQGVAHTTNQPTNQPTNLPTKKRNTPADAGVAPADVGESPLDGGEELVESISREPKVDIRRKTESSPPAGREAAVDPDTPVSARIRPPPEKAALESKPYAADTPVQKVVCAYKVAKNIAWDDRAWDRDNFRRASKPAAVILRAFDQSVRSAAEFIVDFGERMTQINRSWTLETAAKWAWDTRGERDAAKNNGVPR